MDAQQSLQWIRNCLQAGQEMRKAQKDWKLMPKDKDRLKKAIGKELRFDAYLKEAVKLGLIQPDTETNSPQSNLFK